MASSGLEIERAYFTFDESELKGRLKGVARHDGEYLFRAMAFKPTTTDMTTMRVRDEGTRVTMTIKRTAAESRYDLEDEVEVSDFDTTVKMLELMGMQKLYYVEKLRDIWETDRVQIVFDTYPGLPAYLEIEGQTEESVVSLESVLGLAEAQNDARGLYEQHYGITQDRPTDDLSFTTAGTVMEKYITHDRDTFDSRLADQRERVAILVAKKAAGDLRK